MTRDTATLLVLAACLLGVAIFALIHRRDGFGALCAVIIGFSAAVTALVAFAISDRNLAGAAQLEAFAVLVEVIGTLCVAGGAALGLVLWRRTGADLIVEVAAARPGRPAPTLVDASSAAGDGQEEIGEEPQLSADGAEPGPGGDEPSSEGEED